MPQSVAYRSMVFTSLSVPDRSVPQATPRRLIFTHRPRNGANWTRLGGTVDNHLRHASGGSGRVFRRVPLVEGGSSIVAGPAAVEASCWRAEVPRHRGAWGVLADQRALRLCAATLRRGGVTSWCVEGPGTVVGGDAPGMTMVEIRLPEDRLDITALNIWFADLPVGTASAELLRTFGGDLDELEDALREHFADDGSWCRVGNAVHTDVRECRGPADPVGSRTAVACGPLPYRMGSEEGARIPPAFGRSTPSTWTAGARYANPAYRSRTYER